MFTRTLRDSLLAGAGALMVLSGAALAQQSSPNVTVIQPGQGQQGSGQQAQGASTGQQQTAQGGQQQAG